MHAYISRHFLRVGLLAAGVATAVTGGPAQAAEAVAVTHDAVRTVADHRHHTDVRDSFTLRQFGHVAGARLDNRAVARSARCTADDACRSVALSFQIVTLAGDHVRLTAVNDGQALNDHCTGCQTLAAAYQFVVSTHEERRLSSAARAELDGIHRRLDDLGRSRLPAAELKRRTDALAAEVTSVLSAPASFDRPTPRPAVTVHRHLDGWPGH
ncbi:hypothetical protein GCM10010218_26820 [Streptomyces mashuensis]|uniref:Secreted protein n=1 Tax=Streptomyces mashuensis TaxID=33904 RepID=A0A919B204_9ACTN|nr:hypothetical protein [Streptomyces mashuensis]GHF44139.1 hypothetical protein GCM10010218_26820 [Streptomyces mashuensis]